MGKAAKEGRLRGGERSPVQDTRERMVSPSAKERVVCGERDSRPLEGENRFVEKARLSQYSKRNGAARKGERFDHRKNETRYLTRKRGQGHFASAEGRKSVGDPGGGNVQEGAIFGKRRLGWRLTSSRGRREARAEHN